MHDHVGRLDVVYNNADYRLFGAVEELAEQQIRARTETNLFGALWVTQAALPLLRAQGRGHIVQISTIGGVAAFRTPGGYNASKWALVGLTGALAQEVASFGIMVTLVEPGDFATDCSGSSAAHAEAPPAYDEVRAAGWKDIPVGDPAAVGPALLKIVSAEDSPLRVFFGPCPWRRCTSSATSNWRPGSSGPRSPPRLRAPWSEAAHRRRPAPALPMRGRPPRYRTGEAVTHKWTADDVPSRRGRTAVVTGASTVSLFRPREPAPRVACRRRRRHPTPRGGPKAAARIVVTSVL
ncbi:SDR family NAD(P)-dependent oxidoreductase [Streptomyces sp. NPDC055722]